VLLGNKINILGSTWLLAAIASGSPEKVTVCRSCSAPTRCLSELSAKQNTRKSSADVRPCLAAMGWRPETFELDPLLRRPNRFAQEHFAQLIQKISKRSARNLPIQDGRVGCRLADDSTGNSP